MGDTGKIVALVNAIAGQQIAQVKTDITKVSVFPETFGAKGDGTTDDSEAVQAAVNAGFNVRFADNKTYYIADTITIDHDCHIYGGKNTIIKTKTPQSGNVEHSFLVKGTLKKTTTLTGDYSAAGNNGCAGNRLAFEDMEGVGIGDVIVITATDQYYSYARNYYYLGATELIVDKDQNYIYIAEALPFDITETENVTVTVYSAPVAVIEDLHFISEIDSPGHYTYCIRMEYCKDSVVKRCTMDNTDNGLLIHHCVNTLVDNVSISNLPMSGAGVALDHYGICVYSSTNTNVDRVMGEAGNCCLSMTGTIPNINTRIYRSNLSSSNFTNGLDMHENAFNTVVEDCVISGACVYGTVFFNRCRFVRSNKVENATIGIIFRGSHNENFSELHVENCSFDGELRVALNHHSPQNPVQSFDNIFGIVEIKNCKGGRLQYNPSTSATVLSNEIKMLFLENWKNCYEVYHTAGNVIDNCIIRDCTFIYDYIINNHNPVTDGVYLGSIKNFSYESSIPHEHKIYKEGTVLADAPVLPEDVDIVLSSSNPSAKFRVCGINLTPDSADDFIVGTVSGSKGQDLARAEYQTRATISFDGSGNLVHTQGSSATANAFYPVGMTYVKDASKAVISATIKSTGQTGASFYPYVAIVDCDTGKISYRNNGTAKTATSEGVAISREADIPANSAVLLYFYCYSPIANEVTTFEDFIMTITPLFSAPMINDEYKAKRMTGDGTIKSFAGVNNIMCSETTFNVKYGADLVRNPIF